MRPGQDAGLLGRCCRLFKARHRLFRMARHDRRPRQNKVRPARIRRSRARIHRQRLPRQRRSRRQVARRQPRLRQIQPRQLARSRPPQRVIVRLLVKRHIPRPMHLMIHIHAVDQLADRVLQARRVVLKTNHLLIEIRRQHIALGHIVAHPGQPHLLHLLVHSIALDLDLCEIRPLLIRRSGIRLNARIHRPSLDRLDQALDRQVDNIRPQPVLQRSLAHLFENRQKPVHRARTLVKQRLDQVVQVGVPHIAHANLVIDRRHHHHKIRPIHTRIDRMRIELRFHHYQKTPPIVGRSRHLEVVVGRDDHLRQRIVQMVDVVVIGAPAGQPDSMQIHRRRKIAQQRQNLHHLRGIRRHRRQLYRSFESRWRCQI